MPLSEVSINVGVGGLGRRAPNQDKISGIVYYNNTPPAGFATDNMIKVFSVDEAVNLGIVEGSAAHLVEYYHVSEYFRLNPEGELWIGYFSVPVSTYDFVEVDTLQRFAQGEIRQMAVYANALTYASSQATTIQGVVDILVTDGMPVSIIYAADMSAITAITGWPGVGDLRANTDQHVTVVAGQDGGAAGAALYTSEAYSITCLGATLGAVSSAAVNLSIGNPASFNASNGVELETAALANGDLVADLSKTSLGGIKDDGYQILVKRTPSMSGTFFERSPTATPATDDFAWMEITRTVDKASRGVRSALTPQLNSGVLVNADGTLSNDTIGYFTDIARVPLDQMKSDIEVSDFDVIIDPNQDILASSTLEVTIKIIPTGTAEFITVTIGLTNTI